MCSSWKVQGCCARSKKLLGAPGRTTRSKELLAAPGTATRSKKLLDLTLQKASSPARTTHPQRPVGSTREVDLLAPSAKRHPLFAEAKCQVAVLYLGQTLATRR